MISIRKRKSAYQPPRPGMTRIWITGEEADHMLHVMNIFKRIVVREMRDKSNMKSFIALSDLREKIYVCKSGYAAIAQSGSIKLDLKKSEASAITKLLYNAERRKYTGHHLSGGERRRTEIARALATDPKFILLDEPFAGVDPIAVEDIQRIVWKLKERNIGILITDHNVQETLTITDRAYLLYDGNILKSGSAEELASDEQVRRVYLGQNFVLRARKE